MTATAPQVDRTPEVTAFAGACRWTGVRVTDYAAWLHERQKVVTASRSAALWGESPFGDALGVYVQMTMPQPEAPERQLLLDDPRLWGTVLEEPIARTAAEYYDWELRMGGALLVSRKHPHLGATLDAEIRPRAANDWLVYEGKTTGAWRARDWDEETDTPPTYVLIQAQHQLLVTQAPGAVVFCLVGGQRPIRINVDPSPEFHAILLETTAEFIDRLARLDPPPATAQSTAALKTLYPEDSGETVQLPPDAVEWTRELQEIGQQQKALGLRDAELRNLLRQSIGEATYGELAEEVGGKARWKWATVARPGYVVEPSSYRTLIAVKAAKPPAKRRRRQARR